MQPLGHQIIYLASCPSTNSLVLATPEYLDAHGLVVQTPHQTDGRGRMGKSFFSFPGEQLLFSTVIHTHLPPQHVPLISLAAGVAVAQAVAELYGLQPELKWPNDVLLGGRKVCGILVESRRGQQGQQRLVVGIGINCHGNPAQAPEALQPIVTTLEQETGTAVETQPLLQAVLREMQLWITRLEAGEPAPLLDAWRERARLRGRRVRVLGLDPPQTGTVTGLNGDGFLDITLDSGEPHVHHSGELQWLD